MKKKIEKKYVDYLVKKTEEIVNIDSPTGYTEEAASFVKKEFEALGFNAY